MHTTRHIHIQHGTEITPVLLPVDGEASQSLLLSSASLLLDSTVSSCTLKVKGQV